MTRHSQQDLEAFGEWERQAWELRAAPYAAFIGDLTCGSIPALLDAAGVRAGTRLLDVGTGPGFVAVAAAARGAQTRAVDQSAAMVALARERGVDAVAAPVEQLPYPAASFDAVVAGYLLNHLASPEAAVTSMARVLRPGGRFASTVWDLPEENPALGVFGTVASRLGLVSGAPAGPDAHRFAEYREVVALLSPLFDEVAVSRVRWSVTVEPGAWFDAVASGTPRTGAVVAGATDDQRAQMRELYVQVVRETYGDDDGRVQLPAGAVLASATRA